MENNTMLTKEDILRTIQEKNPAVDLSYLNDVEELLKRFRESGATVRGPEFADISRRMRVSNVHGAVTLCERQLLSIL
jgi:dsDNA-specific endonuclease/ATPase MutS2